MGTENQTVRLYGQEPYRVVLVHGGPGAIGSLRGFAQELSERLQIGVVEALQTKYTIAELIEELSDQIRDHCSDKVVLIGHSWGAWLIALLAEKYTELVDKMIMVGSGPLQDKYVPEIGERRLANLSPEESVVFQRVVENQATDEDMKRIPNILDRVDNYCLQDREKHHADKVDSRMHNEVWKEAATIRTSGELLAVFLRIHCPIYLIQGEFDPHPAKGITEPLEENKIACKTYVLEKCGHSPFMEKYAKERFYDILKITV